MNKIKSKTKINNLKINKITDKIKINDQLN